MGHSGTEEEVRHLRGFPTPFATPLQPDITPGSISGLYDDRGGQADLTPLTSPRREPPYRCPPPAPGE